MLLLNARTYALKFFHTAKSAPPYAILSHTWEDDEVLFQDMDDLESAKAKSGWQKIEYICRQALEGGLEWAWVDTCCIDKSSSAELSEAINSMFKWYECSTVCYVYLCDLTMNVTLRDDAPTVSEWLGRAKQMMSVRPSPLVRDLHASETLWQEHVAYLKKVTSETMLATRNDDRGHSRPCNELDTSIIDALGEFSRAKWWSRGWTLQELLAPRNVIFMNQHWQQIARLPAMVVTASTISGVDVEVLLKTASLQSRCIAERLSWASKRSTTREEDTAYALLGIFDANMPLLYGEGSRAFKRLQEQISLRSNDLSIYAWLTPSPVYDHLLFAASPSYFVHCITVRKRSSGTTTGMSASCMGVKLTSSVSTSRGLYWIDLGCYYKSTPHLQIVLVVKPCEGLLENLCSWLQLKAPILHAQSLAATEMREAFARRARRRSLTIIPSPLPSYLSSDFVSPFAALLAVHVPKEQNLAIEQAYPRDFWNLHTHELYCAQQDLAFPLKAGLEFRAPDGRHICLALSLCRFGSDNLPYSGTQPVSSALVCDLDFDYRCFAELVPELALDQACTQFPQVHTHATSLTDLAPSEHPNHSQNVSRPVVGGRHLTVEVVRTRGHDIDNAMIMFDIFIHATTPAIEYRNTGRFPWLKRKAQSTKLGPSTRCELEN
ncbi:hypothetical protein D0862_14403 [Hortaea werneckii]|uniref:Heterokaryon incompatibility domain-containing protein n=1 Tax=Hortaea werneckii TaxID=91943 RepID=A0A3M7E800_HORWE|nr:hypothetical protein D0862_14403 [Hortaea werneckii]